MSLQELKGGDDAQELLAHVVALDVDRVDDVVVVAVVGVVRLGAAVDEGLEAFEEVAEKVDVDEVGEPCEALEGGGEEGRAVVELDDAEVERKEKLERLGHVPLALLLVDLALGLAHLAVDLVLLLARLARLLRALLGHGLLGLAALAALVVLLLVPPHDAVLALALAEDGVGRRARAAPELVLEAQVEESRDDLGPDGERARANEARDEAHEVERVEGGRRRVVLEQVDDGVERLLVALVPALAAETLDDDVHDVRRKVEVGLLAHAGAQAVQRGGSDRRVLCERYETSAMRSVTRCCQGEAEESSRRTGHLVLADLEELLVRRDEAVLPLALPSDHLADLDVLLGLGELADAVPTAGEEEQEGGREGSASAHDDDEDRLLESERGRTAGCRCRRRGATPWP